MASTLCAIITAYLLGALILRADFQIERTRPILGPLLNGLTVTAISCLLLGTFHWTILLSLLLTLVVTAAIEAHVTPDSTTLFAICHCLRLAAFLAIAYYLPDAVKNGWWTKSLKPDIWRWYFGCLSCVAGVILCVPVGSNVIARLISRFTNEVREYDISGLAEGGRYIGYLERILVMLLVLINQPSGIGFLITAKSILRFGEIKDASQRKVAEYVIIGTFLSFGWALFISILTQKAIGHWIP
jgi:hypothetical protein